MKKNRAFKFVGLSLAAALTIGLAACSSEEDKKSTTTPGDVVETDTSTKPSGTDEASKVNRLALERKLDYVKNNYIDGGNTKYEKDGYDALVEAYNAAKLVYEKKDATQAELDSEVSKLDSAIEALVVVVKPSKTIDQIASWMEETNGNYTLNVVDHFSKDEYKTAPHEYKVLSTGDAVYDADSNFGLANYDGFVHEFKLDGDEFVMGRKYLGDNLFPSSELEAKRFYSRAVNVLGKSEPFTSFGFPLYGFFVNTKGTTIYKSDNSNFYDFYLGLVPNRYSYGNKVEEMFSAATMEFENDVFKATLLDNDGNVAFEFSVSDAKTTSIKGLAEYKEANPKYQTNEKYNPRAKAQDIIAKDALKLSGIRLDIFQNQRGLSYQKPNFTLTSRINPQGTSYWESSLGYGILEENGSNIKFTIENGELKIGERSTIEVSDLDIVRDVIKAYNEALAADGDDEYYLPEVGTDLQNALYSFFDLANYQSWAVKNYFDDEAKKVKATDITRVSISLNEEGNLTISLWNEDSLICRGVVVAYQNVKSDLVEDAFDESKKIAKVIERVEAITNSDNKYEARSFEAVQNALSIAKELLNSETATSFDLKEARILLESREAELELATFTPSEKGYNEVLNYIDGKIYEDEFGIGDYTFMGYKLSVTENGKTTTTIINNKYSFNETTGTGLFTFEGVVYSFSLSDGVVTLGDPFIRPAGFSEKYLSRVVTKIGRVSSMCLDESATFNPKTDMVRIPNSNEWFISNVNYAKFLGASLDGKMGVGLEVVDGNLVIKLYDEVKLDAYNPSLELNKLVELRGKPSVTAVISNVGKAKNEALDEIIKSNNISTAKAQVQLISTLLPKTTKVISGADGSVQLFNEKFMYNASDETAYVLVSGKVKKIKIDLTADGLPFTVLENEVKVNGVAATSIKDVCGDILSIAKVGMDDLLDYTIDEFVSKNKYLLADNYQNSLKPFFGYESSEEADYDFVLSINNQFEVTLGEYNTLANRYESYYKLTGRLTDSEEQLSVMIPNFIFAMENMPM